jgi:hypothetical protein
MGYRIDSDSVFSDEQSNTILSYSSALSQSQIPGIYQPKNKKRKSWIYRPENGSEYHQARGTRLRCARYK